ncbi:non-ribosomal peptide synthetase [Aquimarina muelleri]|uniref:Carrier domain-containing protein n=1 Tax=Aquimarina muelleri TaxID=279356 RepID=A0A918JUE7_9FLAO|nr:non-ribosomal peptide synthetase [Aquimarina muelleri]MCX2762222.1 non-ribosomal peptide synthetase [Aquimarina muelleri]GGX16522.1 hypothetical protein GCM10007384_17470 [Aquimarina muelleri]
MQNNIKPIEIVYAAQVKGINLFVDHGKLAIKKDKNIILPPDLIKIIKENKTELIDFLEKDVRSSLGSDFINIKKIPESDSYKISNAQRRLWLVSQLEEASIACNIPNTIVLDKVYDITCFQKAIYSVIERHEILRTVFKVDDLGEIRQFVLNSKELNLAIGYKDCRGKDAEVIAKEYVKNDSYKPFDLEKGPLLRVCLLRLSEDKYIYYYNLHHIISDGWSTDVLSRDIMQYYNAYLSGVSPDISPLRIQYKDYTAWQLEQSDNDTQKRHKEYWLEKLSGELPIIDLPSYKPRPKSKTYNGKCLGGYFSKDVTKKLDRFIKENNGNLFMLMLSGINILLHKYTSAKDIIIGSPFAGRTHPDLEDQIGFYVNILALRNTIDPTDSFIEYYQKIKENTVEDYRHQEYAFDKLVEDLEIKYDQSRTALFDISWELHKNIENTTCVEDHLLDEIKDRGNTVCKNDIEFHATKLEDVIALDVIYNTDIYDEDMISNMIQHFKQLMLNLLSSPKAALSTIEFLTKKDRYEILDVFNATEVTYPLGKTVVELFVEQANNTPETVAVVFGNKTLTYIELEKKSNQLANYLIKEYNIDKEDFVGVHLDKSEQCIVCLLAILKAGAVYVPIDTNYPLDRKQYIIDDANIKVLITNDSYISDIKFFNDSLLVIDSVFDVVNYDLENINYASPNGLAYVIYTSGSTGNPKGVMIEHKAVLNAILAHIDVFNITSNLRVLQFMSFSFDVSISEIFNTLLSGSSLFIANKEIRNNPYLLGQYIQDNAIDIVTLPASFFHIMKPESFKNVKTLIVGGEASDYRRVISYLFYGGSYYNAYGPTEASICASTFKITNAAAIDSKNIPIGTPVSNTEFLILSKDLQLMPVGAIGELCIGGTQLARGYLNRPDLTSDKFIDNPFKKGARLYKTGDLARWLPNGNVEFIGRIDHQVKIRGYRIELGEIELAVEQIQDIEQSVVIVKKDAYGSKHLVAYLVSNKEINFTKVRQIIEGKLPEYMVPKIYVQLEKIPLTNNGKIDSKALPSPDENSYNKKEYIKPVTQEEKKLAIIWQSILGIKTVGVKDNFYDLGGNSIKSIQLISLLKKKGYNLSVRDSIENPILEDMAKTIDKSTIEVGKLQKKSELQIQELNDGVHQNATKKNISSDEYNLVSENQIFFLRKPSAMISSNTIVISNFSKNNFEEKFRNLLSFYPSLTVSFKKREFEDEILQKQVSKDKVKLDINILEGFLPKHQVEIERKSNSFLKKVFNYFDQTALIRVFIVVDKDNLNTAYLRFSIAHALLDVDTFGDFLENLNANLEQPKTPKISISNDSFALWQKNFLNSKKGITQRNWWLNYLKNLHLVETKIPIKNEFSDYVVQHTTIIGEQYEIINEIVKNLKLPITALFLGAHQSLLEELDVKNSCMQMIAVNGKEESYEEIDITKVLGVTTNFLPLPIISAAGKSVKEHVYDVYEQYLKIRLYQKIPYGIIRKDFSELDIDKHIRGYFNFSFQKNREIEKNQTNTETSISLEKFWWDDFYGLGLVCVVFKNGISLRLVCPKKTYENNQQNFSLNSFIEKRILGLKDLILV